MVTERSWIGYACAAGGALACTLIGLAMRPRFDIVNIAMVYLLAVVIVALRFTRGAAIASAVLCVLAFDVVFVPPEGTVTVDDIQYLLTFVIILAVALIISSLMTGSRKQAEAKARLALEAESERIRSTLLASISHDLRTPLAVMVGASSSLVEKGERMTAQERSVLAKSIFDRARALSEQMSKLLQMTRFDTGAITLQRDWTAFSEIAGTVLARLSERLAGHRLMVEIPADLPLIRVDAMLIDQALANLLENAAQHTPPGTVIRLRAKVDGKVVLVSVEDFGPGIDDKDMERLFAKFHHGRAAGGGVGLGLAICRAIIALHGGDTWADRVQGGGMAFHFTVPIEQTPPVPAEPEIA
jgi:two-component system sensor histidine kinase KdpD